MYYSYFERVTDLFKIRKFEINLFKEILFNSNYVLALDSICSDTECESSLK